ncbi:DivIVA domain-containing protein [Auraticoccus monumenti]|uniref:DivIVA domain-containing protein n=2 Tax=Auraticoccus monumenti TaxID=675864 RepID=A0A1G7ABZ7_9ACTN|nr:DivIVA domain-containing protein [Auraticoccus monumenti]
MAVVAVAVLAIGAVAATGRLGGMAEEPVRDSLRRPLPPHPLGEQDVVAVRLGVALRGYSMTEVDELLERLAREVGERDERIAALEHQLSTQDVHLGALERERDERQVRPSDRDDLESAEVFGPRPQERSA